MSPRADAILELVLGLPEWLVYLVIGFAAAIENVIPPLPSDVVILAGGVVAGAGGARPIGLFLAVWLANVGSALMVYGLGRRYGTRFFEGPLGRFLLVPDQLAALSRAYSRFGLPIIFFSRFLPVFRPVVPAFAGIARVGFWATAIPLAAASAVWYGALVYAGALAGSNWDEIIELLSRVGRWLWIAAAFLLLLLVWWWWSSRRSSAEDVGGGYYEP